MAVIRPHGSGTLLGPLLLLSLASFARANSVRIPLLASALPTPRHADVSARALQTTAPCGKTSPKIGYQCPLDPDPSSGHNVAGEVYITSDCTFEVRGFTLTPGGPAVYFWQSAGVERAQQLFGSRLGDMSIEGEVTTPTTYTVNLVPGATWDKVGAITVWCEEFRADFAHILLQDISTPTPAPVVKTPAAMPPSVASAPCAKTSRKIGYQGPLTPVPSSGHDVKGEVYITSDCSFEVRRFTLIPGGPDVYFWQSAGLQRAQQLKGSRLGGMKIEGDVLTPTTFTVTLAPGATWDKVGAIIVWCEEFKADFGHILLSDAPKPLPVPPTAVSPAMAPSVDIRSQFSHCMATSGKMNIFWNAPSQGRITIGVEAAFDQSAGWAAVGVNSPATTDKVSMIGSDLVVVGYDNTGKPFAIPYMVNLRSQCDYSGTRTNGVCPNATLIPQVKMLSASRTPDNIVTVSFSRPYTAQFQQQVLGLWAYGPITEDQKEPVVLYHTVNRAPTDFKINFASTPGKAACTPLAAGTGSKERVEPRTISDTQNFTVTVGANPNYPNPPAWGVSYMVNGFESPVLNVVRGQTYTFNVLSGESHPFYITTSILGGFFDKSEQIFAGGPESYSKDGVTPAVVVFQPNASAPDTLYYMCTVHQKIGWKIAVQDAGEAEQAASPSASTSASPKAALTLNPNLSSALLCMLMLMMVLL